MLDGNKREGNQGFSSKFDFATNSIVTIMEYIVVLLAILAVCITIVQMLPELAKLGRGPGDTSHMMAFMEGILNIVIGMEFIRMLCRPSRANVIETMIFVIARHLIIEDTTPLENLLSTLSMILLIMTDWWLKYQGNMFFFQKRKLKKHHKIKEKAEKQGEKEAEEV